MTIFSRAFRNGAVFLGLTLLLAGCTGPRLLMPTPNVHLDPDSDYYGGLAPELKSTEVSLFFVTDRQPEQDENGNLRYGYARSPSLSFGTTIVELGEDITWEELLEASRTQRPTKDIVLDLVAVEEVARGPNLPLPSKEEDGRIVEQPDLLAQHEASGEAFRRALAESLELTPRKEVFIYVHGFNNSFDDAAFAMAELWHFLGRIGVPVIYTWPANHPGLFGYTYDRESSEFTIYHLREFLSLIASFPEVEKIHLIAHSRGTDVAATAVRELTIGARAAGIDPKTKFKIHNLVLAAPDLDAQVAVQRLAGDKLALSVRRFTIYASPEDEAIGLATKLFASPRGRVGTLQIEDISDTAKAALAYDLDRIAIINYTPAVGSTFLRNDRYRHSYFRNAPTVSSDLVLMLRDDFDPGTPGRPLESIGFGFWSVPPGYPSANPSE